MNPYNILQNPVFLICCLLFMLHQVIQKILTFPILLADAYLDNFLSTPIILTLMLVERRWLFNDNKYRFTVSEVVIATIVILLITELVFPYISTRFTGDGYDIIFCGAGSLLFYGTINK